MKYLVLVACLLVVLGLTAHRPTPHLKAVAVVGGETAKLQVVTSSGTEKEYTIELPSGPPPTGDTSSLKAVDKQIIKILSENNIDCPPKREKVIDKVWRCGNGNIIKTSNARLARLFAKAWS